MNALTKGLEASILRLSVVKAENRDIRIDSFYFSRAALAADALVATKNPVPVHDVATDVRSFGAYALTNEFEYQDEGVAFLRGTNFSGDFMDFEDVLRISPEAHALLHKSEVRPGMVLLSMSGSVGSVAVALDSWQYPINSNQDIAKIIPESISPFYLAAFLSSSFGRTQIDRLPVGSVQQHIFLWMIERIQIPRFGSTLEKRISLLSQRAYETNEIVTQHFARAEETLLAALGLSDWNPPKPVAYQKSASALRLAKRFDAEFFDPRHMYAEDVISSCGFDTVGHLATFVSSGPAWPSSSFTTAEDPDGIPFVRIRNCKPGVIKTSDLDRLRMNELENFKAAAAKSGDLAIGMDGIKWFYAGILDGDAYINQRVGWVRLKENSPSPHFLQLVINSPLGQAQLLRRMTIAQTVGHVTLDDIRSLKIPRLPRLYEAKITETIQAGIQARERASQLLRAAKRAVEIAIEEDEPAALVFLERADEEF